MTAKLRTIARGLVATPERRLVVQALVTRLIPAILIYGTDDVQGWETWGRLLLGGQNPYASKYPIAWPPLWIPVTALAFSISETFHLPFHFVAKLFPIAADLVITLLLYAVAGRHGRRAYETARAYALNPVSIYVTAVHGQFDPYPALCVACAVLLYSGAEDDRSGTRAGAWLGVGAALKTWPLMVLPALVAPVMAWRRRIVLSAVALTVFTIALVAPLPFAGRIAITAPLHYRGAPNWWGLSSIASLLEASVPETVFSRIFYASMVFAAVIVMLRRVPPATGTLFLLLTFYVATPGFGIQYLVWLLPVALIVDPENTLRYTALATAVIAFEVLLRPHGGWIGDTVRVLPHSGYARAYGGPHDHTMTIADRLPLWAFFVWWWSATLLRIARHRGAREETP